MWIWSLGWEDPLEKEMTTHSSILAWKIPWTEKPGMLQFMGPQRVIYDWAHMLKITHKQLLSQTFLHWCRWRAGSFSSTGSFHYGQNNMNFHCICLGPISVYCILLDHYHLDHLPPRNTFLPNHFNCGVCLFGGGFKNHLILTQLIISFPKLWQTLDLHNR